MDDWIDFYDKSPSIYVSRRHRDVHFRQVAQAIIGLIPAPDAVVLDYACGEALNAADVASACATLLLAEPAPGVRARLGARHAGNAKITVTSLEALDAFAPASVDLAVMNSVAQYMTAEEFDAALARVRMLLKPSGRFVLGDIIPRDAGMLPDVASLLRFGANNGFLIDALTGLAKTALSDYRQLRARIGLQRYTEAEMLEKLRSAGFRAERSAANLGHNPWRMTFEARPQAG